MLSPQTAASKDLVSPPSFPPRGGPRGSACRAAQQGGGRGEEEAWKKNGRRGIDKRGATAISARGFEVEDKGRTQGEEVVGGERRGSTPPFFKSFDRKGCDGVAREASVSGFT